MFLMQLTSLVLQTLPSCKERVW